MVVTEAFLLNAALIKTKCVSSLFYFFLFPSSNVMYTEILWR